MELEQQFDKTQFIIGMRGYSALAVFLIHSGGMGLRQFSEFTNKVVNHGQYGVISFFVLSAFTICMSIDREKNFKFGTYFLKRFFRIMPMYAVACIVAFFLGGVEYYLDFFGVNSNLLNLFYHLTLLNLFDYRYQNSLIGVEWSIPVECFFYLLLPMAFMAVKRWPSSLAIILIVTAMLSVNGYFLYERYVTHDKDIYDLVYRWSVVKFVFSFAFGILIYRVRNILDTKVNSFVILLWFLLLINYINLNYPYQDLFYTIWVGGLILFCAAKSTLSKLLFENRIILYIGNISYSLYLVHFIVIVHWFPTFADTMTSLLVLAITLVISSITHTLIEKPGINFAKKLVAKL